MSIEKKLIARNRSKESAVKNYSKMTVFGRLGMLMSR